MYKYSNSLLIGLTGGVGSGKSTVAKIIEKKGYPVYYSDIRAKEIVDNDEVLKRKITTLLGDEAYDEQGRYDRKWVAERVFKNKNLLSQLNTLIHPTVRQDFEKWKSIQNSRLIFKETALLFELNLDKYCDKSILVTANQEVRISRVMQRDGRTRQQVIEIMSKQMPEKEKRQRADFVIENNQDKEQLQNKVEEILEKLIGKRD